MNNTQDSEQPAIPPLPPAHGSAQSFVVIYHHWWLDSGSFLEEIIEAKDRKEAEMMAAAKCHNTRYTFQHWDYHIVKAVVQTTYEPKPRALTWKERLTGHIEPNAPHEPRGANDQQL